jgi:hypothetical protein
MGEDSDHDIDEDSSWYEVERVFHDDVAVVAVDGDGRESQHAAAMGYAFLVAASFTSLFS